MKLRNKKTREIGYFCFANRNDSVLIIMDKDGVQLAKYTSLAELNAEWEGAPEKPKKHYAISQFGDVINEVDLYMSETIDDMKEIGNYFDTEEEAEQAVEKLKAWKRLKDKGFRFTKWTIPEEPKTPHIKLVIEAEMDVPDSPYDLDLLFGGEDK